MRAIVALTESGGTAQWLSRFRSTVPIYALSRDAARAGACMLYRDVHPVDFDPQGVGPAQAAREAIQHLFKRGDLAEERPRDHHQRRSHRPARRHQYA